MRRPGLAGRIPGTALVAAEVVRAMAREARPRAALAAGLRALVRLEPVHGIQTYVLDERRRTLRNVAAVGFARDLIAQTSEIPVDLPASAGSLTVRAFRTGQICCVPDYARVRAGIVSRRLRGAFHTVAAAPMQIRGRTTGVLLVAYTTAGPLSPSRELLLSVLARHMALAVERGRLLEETERRAAAQEALASIAQEVAAGRSLEQVLESSIRIGMRATGATRGGVMLADPRLRILRLGATVGLPAVVNRLLRAQGIRYGKYLPGIAAETGEPAVLQDFGGVRPERGRLARWAFRLGVRSMASVPMKSGGRVVGALTLAGPRPGLFLPSVLDTLGAIGSQLGSAVQLAQLVEDARRSAARLRAEGDFSRQLSEGAPAGLLLVREDGTVASANAWFLRRVGAPRDAVEGHGFDRWVEGPDLARVGFGASVEAGAFVRGPGGVRWPARIRLLAARRGRAGERLVVVEDQTPRLEAAVERARLDDELRAAREISGWITTTMQVAPTARAVASFWRRAGRADAAVLWLAPGPPPGSDARSAAGRTIVRTAVAGSASAAARAARRLPVSARRRSAAVALQRAHGSPGTEVWVPLVGPDGLSGAVQLVYVRARPIPAGEMDRFLLLGQSTSVAIRAARQTEALAEQGRRLRELTRAFLAAQERERRRIAAELHDEVGSSLTGIRLNLASVERSLGDGRGPGSDLARALAGRCRDSALLAERTLGGIRRMIRDLRPGLLDELGLGPAVRAHAEEVGRRTGLEIRVRTAAPRQRPGPGIEAVLFRIVQDGLADVARRADATRVQVVVARRGGRIEVVVAEDGVGRAGGLTSDLEAGRERIVALGGTLDLETSARGRRIVARIPVHGR